MRKSYASAGVLHVKVYNVGSGEVRTASVLRLGDKAPGKLGPTELAACSEAVEGSGRQADVALVRALQRTYGIR